MQTNFYTPLERSRLITNRVDISFGASKSDGITSKNGLITSRFRGFEQKKPVVKAHPARGISGRHLRENFEGCHQCWAEQHSIAAAGRTVPLPVEAGSPTISETACGPCSIPVSSSFSNRRCRKRMAGLSFILRLSAEQASRGRGLTGCPALM